MPEEQDTVAEEEQEELTMMVELGSKSIDLSPILPLKLRDWKVLEKKGITAKALQETKISDISSILYYVLHKADNTVTIDEVDDLDMNHPVIASVLKYLTREKINRPT